MYMIKVCVAVMNVIKVLGISIMYLLAFSFQDIDFGLFVGPVKVPGHLKRTKGSVQALRDCLKLHFWMTLASHQPCDYGQQLICTVYHWTHPTKQ